jgi:hypothetical protein
MTIQAQVNKYIEKNPSASVEDILQQFPKKNVNTLKSCYRRIQKRAGDVHFDASKITMDQVEKLIIEGKTPVPLLRVMTDFLKIKSQDHSELQEIDLNLFYKKGMED